MTDSLIQMNERQTIDQDEYDSTYECSFKSTSDSEDEDHDMFEDDSVCESLETVESNSTFGHSGTNFQSYDYLPSNMIEMDIN